MLHGPPSTILEDVEIDIFSFSDIESLRRECHVTYNIGLLPLLEKALLGYPVRALSFSAVETRSLNVRKSVSWKEELTQCFPAFRQHCTVTMQLPACKSCSGNRHGRQYSRSSAAGKTGHDGPVHALAFSSDGQLVATASADSTIILWDAHSACISQEYFAHNGDVNDLAFSPDGQYLASAGRDGKVEIWDIIQDARRLTTLAAHGGNYPIVACAWFPDGTHIAYRTSDSVTHLCDAHTFQHLRILDPTHMGYEHAKHISVSPDSRWIAGRSEGGYGVWDIASGVFYPLEDTDKASEDTATSRAIFDKESMRLALGYMDGSIRVWDIETARELLFLVAHVNVVRDMAFSPDGRMLLSASQDRMVKIWDAHTGDVLASLEGHEDWVLAACFSPCGRYVASASDDTTVKLWRMSDGSCLRTLREHDGPVTHVAFSCDGAMLWSAARDGTVCVRRLVDVVLNPTLS